MTALVTPDDAVAAVRGRVRQRWADAVCAELGIGDGVVFTVPLRPGVSSGKDVERLGYTAWHEWHTRWRELSGRLPAGVEVVRRAEKGPGRGFGRLPVAGMGRGGQAVAEV